MSCPDDNVLVRMVDGALDPTAFADVEVHIDSCEHCRKIIAAAVATKTLAVGTPPITDESDALAAIVDVSINGRYVIEAVLGRGGMGTVYLARDQTLNRDVALKLHRAGSGHDRLHREAIAMAKLAHPNVVTVFEIGTIDDRMYVAMEYVRGETLRGWLDAKPRAWREIIDMLVATGQGLAAAHAAGLIHRDFKPENVLVGEDGRPRVSDFGLARVGASRDSKPSGLLGTNMTQSGAILGTPAYMSPEQLAGDTVDARCDQFAFCVVAWECLFSKRPFTGATLAALEDAMQRRDIKRPGRTEVPQRVRDVLERGLAIDPNDRFADMPALLGALRTATTPRTKRYLAAGLATAVLVGGGGYAALTMLEARRQEAACVAEGDKVRSLFDQGKRDAIKRAFEATGSRFAGDSFTRAANVLAEYSEKLAQQTLAVCRGRDEPLSLTAARRGCLGERTTELTTMVDVLASADASLVQRAPGVAWSMFDPHPCSDPSVLHARPATPAPSSSAIYLGRINALIDAGRDNEAIAAIEPILAKARADKDRNIELALLIKLGNARMDEDKPAEVAPIFHEILQLAETLGRDQEAAGALWSLANIAATQQHEHQAAHRYIALARAKLARLGGGNLAIRGELSLTEGQVLYEEFRLGEAERATRQAVVALEYAYGPQHPKFGGALGTLTNILWAQHKHGEALATGLRTLEIFTNAYGPDHPMVAGSEMTVAMSLTQLDRFAEARERLQRADAGFIKMYGEGHPVRASLAANLGSIEQQERNWDAALVQYRRAVEILTRVEGPDSPYVAQARGDVARVLALTGKMTDAIKESEAIVATLEKLGPDGLPRLHMAYVELADYELVNGQAAKALPHALRALELAQARPPDANPGELADAKSAAGRAIWETKGDRARAKQLLDEARPLLDQPEKVKMLDDWMAKHKL